MLWFFIENEWINFLPFSRILCKTWLINGKSIFLLGNTYVTRIKCFRNVKKSIWILFLKNQRNTYIWKQKAIQEIQDREYRALKPESDETEDSDIIIKLLNSMEFKKKDLIIKRLGKITQGPTRLVKIRIKS